MISSPIAVSSGRFVKPKGSHEVIGLFTKPHVHLPPRACSLHFGERYESGGGARSQDNAFFVLWCVVHKLKQ